MSGGGRQRRASLAASAILAGLTLAFFWKIALTNRVLVGLDIFTYFYPYRDAVAEALRAGRLPLWNPYLFMGAPLLANSQVAVLYPPNWLLIWLSPPKQVAWSIVSHIWLAGAGAYLFARRAVQLDRLPALTAAVVFAFGGFLGAQVEHVNQLNVSAWLPWLLLCLEEGARRGRRRWAGLIAGGVVVALMLLAGHMQAAYIVVFGSAIYVAAKGFARPLSWRRLAGLGRLALVLLAGAGLAAAQLLPTLELSRLSVRSGGLSYREAVSFSLKPQLVLQAFFPPLAWDPPFSEYVAYVGLVGLALAAAGGWVVLRRREGSQATQARLPAGRPAAVLAIVGVFLAFGAYNPAYYVFYKLVPGFSLFRAPARWLLLFSFGAAILAGIGAQAIRKPERLRPALLLLLVVELFVAGRRLAYNQPTAPLAYHSMRSAPAHLLAHREHEDPLFRFLSLSDIVFDPGDLGDLQAMYASQLPEQAVYDLVVATKMKEVLAFNLPLRDHLFSVDGYDGGLLPTAQYVTFERLFLDDDEIWPDGRLRQQLRAVPPTRLLSLLNVEFVITDKVQDAWIDDVYYDLEHTVSLGQVTLDGLPEFTATDLGFVSYLTGTADLGDGTPVAQVTVTDTAGATAQMTIHAGEHTAEGLYRPGETAHRQARIGHHWRDDPRGSDYVARLALGRALVPQAISIRSLLPPGAARLALRGLTLIDARTGTSRSLSVDPDWLLVHSGDVKIYRNRAALPRAFVVYGARVVEDDERALALLSDPEFDPGTEVLLAGGSELAEIGAGGRVEIVRYEPEHVEVHARLDTPGYLVLSDAYYPGWVAEVDGQPRPILRANLYFRAVQLEAGEHDVVFYFTPSSVRLGLTASLATCATLSLAAALLWRHTGRRRRTGV